MMNINPFSAIDETSDKKSQHQQHPDVTTSLRGPRTLLQTKTFDVPLFLELQYLNETIVVELESQQVQTDAITTFCSCIKKQVRHFNRFIS